MLRAPLATLVVLASFFSLSSRVASAQTLSPVCTPSVTSPIVVVSAAQRLAAGAKAPPPLTDTNSGFAWPDTPLGIIKTNNGYEFFASDGGAHYRQIWQGHWVGNNKSGSFTTTVGTLDNPLGTGDPKDVSVSSNPDISVNPIYPSYGYMGGGPVYQVPRRVRETCWLPITGNSPMMRSTRRSAWRHPSITDYTGPILGKSFA